MKEYINVTYFGLRFKSNETPENEIGFYSPRHIWFAILDWMYGLNASKERNERIQNTYIRYHDEYISLPSEVSVHHSVFLPVWSILSCPSCYQLVVATFNVGVVCRIISMWTFNFFMIQNMSVINWSSIGSMLGQCWHLAWYLTKAKCLLGTYQMLTEIFMANSIMR